MKNQVRFTHLFVKGFGWENTIYQEEDFEQVECLGANDKDGTIYQGTWDNGVSVILKNERRFEC